jgi:hypothetical protein
MRVLFSEAEVSAVKGALLLDGLSVMQPENEIIIEQ